MRKGFPVERVGMGPARQPFILARMCYTAPQTRRNKP